MAPSESEGPSGFTALPATGRRAGIAGRRGGRKGRLG
jgi:hypothetical protein